jgi:hypothetical protein
MAKQNATDKTDKVRSLLGKLPVKKNPSEPPDLIQEAKPMAKLGRKTYRLEGVKYVRISPALPESLKIEMDVAIKTRFRDSCPTIDTFVEQAVREFLGK